MADDKIYYIDANNVAHSTPGECIDANLQIESVNGQFNTGGNCGQSSDNIQSSDSNTSSNSNSDEA